MDFTAILGALPTIGPVGVILVILTYVGRQWLVSDRRYQAELDRLTKAHEAELIRINKAHDEEIKEFRQDIRELKAEIIQLRNDLATERNERMRAQEEAHRIRMQSGTDL